MQNNSLNKYVLAMKNLAVDALYHAKSGHPGMGMSACNLTFALYTHFINIDKDHPKWLNRDRFVLSGGHGCLSIYSIFHLSGLINKQEIEKFRCGSKFYPGHPEYELDNYIDASTGPLGQGVANAVGMAIAQKYLQHRFEPIKELVDHYTYVVCGDGDLQEGISYEAMSIAGNLKLNKLIILYDSNDFQLDSAVKTVNNENIKQRVESQNWNYIYCNNNLDEIIKAVETAKTSLDKPTFIEVKTIIGEGLSFANSFKAHGAKIDHDEWLNFKKSNNLKEALFTFDDDIYEYFEKQVVSRGHDKYVEWNEKLNYFLKKEPVLTERLINNFNCNFDDLVKYLDINEITKNNDATKTYLKTYFDQLAESLDVLTLSADLASTTNCKNNAISFNEDYNSSYIMLGVREHAMAAIQNGILYHGGVLSFAGTFLSFSDYMKPAIRIAAMTKLPSSYILSHDSYLVGPDGPTHQPYDQIPMLRAIDNVYVLRPCDEVELLGCMNLCLSNKSHVYCLVLTRQAVPSRYQTSSNKIAQGAYVLSDEDDADITLIANGSEIELAMNAVAALKEAFNIKVKVVSCPCLKLFLKQDHKYIKKILHSRNGVISIEASNDYMWYELGNYVKKFKRIAASSFGYSDEGKIVYENKGFNIDNVIKKCQELINEKK